MFWVYICMFLFVCLFRLLTQEEIAQRRELARQRHAERMAAIQIAENHKDVTPSELMPHTTQPAGHGTGTVSLLSHLPVWYTLTKHFL